MTTIEQGRDGALTEAAARDTTDDQARAERAATERRYHRQLLNLAIRVASLAFCAWSYLVTWSAGGVFTGWDAVAADDMIKSGEPWQYLWPSLVVLGIGLSLAAVAALRSGCCWRVIGCSTWR